MLGIKARRLLLSLHIGVTAIWFGAVFVMLFLLYSKRELVNGDEIAAIDRTLFQIHDVVVINASFVFVYTGLLFSLFTKWGFLKFYWVILKWVGLVVLSGIVTFASAPAINGMAALSDVLRDTTIGDVTYAQYSRDAAVFLMMQLVILLGLIMLSVYKPWGLRKKQITVPRRWALAGGAAVAISVAAIIYIQYDILQTMRQTAIPSVDLRQVSDGVYPGETNFGGFVYSVEVTVEEHVITDITIVQNRAGVYPSVAEGVVDKVIQAQQVDIDAVTGATTTSKAFLLAIEDALRQGIEGN